MIHVHLATFISSGRLGAVLPLDEQLSEQFSNSSAAFGMFIVASTRFAGP